MIEGRNYLADINIDGFEPLSQPLVTTGVIDKGVYGVYDNVQRFVIGKTFKESSELSHCKIEI